MRPWLAVAVIIAAFPQAAGAQAVPEGIHQNANGPAEMCGLVGRDARDLIKKARASPNLVLTDIGSDRFELFQSDPPTYQLVATKPSEPAHPAVSCRRLFEENGSLQIDRSMRCDAGRSVCDALFIEFQELDAAMIKAVRGGG